MIIIPPNAFIPKRKRASAAPVPPPVVGPVLVAASYEKDNFVQLSFDRAIDAGGVIGTQIFVADGINGKTYNATSAVTVIDPQTVRIGLIEIGATLGISVTLSASAENGIVASDDHEPWAG